jgi:hypothetical protein
MSRPYRVRVRESHREVIAAEDSITSKIDVVPVLDKAGTEQVARTILREHGFKEGEDGSMSRSKDGVEVTVDPRPGDDGSLSVEAKASANEEHLLEGEDEAGGGCPCSTRSEEAVREALRKRLRDQAGALHGAAQREVTGRLLGALGDLGCECEQIASQVTKRALKRRAQEMGQIRSITHDEKTGGMTIVVELPS